VYELPPEAVKLSRIWEWLVVVAVALLFMGAIHLHVMLSVGDWDMFVDWKDRQFWVLVVPVSMMMIPAALQAVFWHYFRLPIGMTLGATLLLVATWITRVVGWHIWGYFPFSLGIPSTILVGALACDAILLIVRSSLLTSTFGGFLVAFLFFPSNWPAHVLSAGRHQGVVASIWISSATYPRAGAEYTPSSGGTLPSRAPRLGVVTSPASCASHAHAVVAHRARVRHAALRQHLHPLPALRRPAGRRTAGGEELSRPRRRHMRATLHRLGRAIPGILLLVGVAQALPAFAHGERAQEPYLRTRTTHWYDVTWSTAKLAVNEEITVTAKFRLFGEWPDAVDLPETVFVSNATPGPVLARVESYLNGVPARQSFRNLEIGRDTTRWREGAFPAPPRASDDRGEGVGPLVVRKWVGITGEMATSFPVDTISGEKIEDLETWGVMTAVRWHALWLLIAAAWIIWWIRRPLLIPRYLALQKEREDLLTTNSRSQVGIGLLVVTLALAFGGYSWARNSIRAPCRCRVAPCTRRPCRCRRKR
jgi:methane monooxygenase/ammonia monooxygenase subunit A